MLKTQNWSLELQENGFALLKAAVSSQIVNELVESIECILREDSKSAGAPLAETLSTVPNHPGEDLGIGLLKQIEKDLAPCLGQGWLNL